MTQDVSIAEGELPEPPRDGRLYHYTDAGGLLGIIQYRVLWAGDVWFMNDTREARYGVQVMRQALASVEPADALEGEVRDTALELLASAERADIRSYITCLSLRGDQLSQWRAYGSPRGFSLGFDAAALRRDAHTSSGLDATLRTVEYGTDVQQAMFGGFFRGAVAEAERRRAEGGAVGDFAGLFLTNALFLAPAFKDAAFAEEEEVRLHVFGDPSSTGLKFRNGAMGLTPYVEIHLADKESGTIPALREIIVGPQPNHREALRATKQLLACHGYQDVEVRPSAVPLRA